MSLINIIPFARRLALSLMMGTTLSLAACGGGGGMDEDDNQNGVIDVEEVETQYTIDSTPELDGSVFGPQLNPAGRSDLPVAVGDGAFVVGSGSSLFEGYYSFDLSNLPVGARIVSAQMSLYQTRSAGDPQGMMVLVRLDHVNFGNAFPEIFAAGNTLEFNFAQIADLASVGRKDVDVSDQVQADLDAGRTRSQFRLRGAVRTNNDNVADAIVLTDAEDTEGTGELPMLIIEIEMP